MDRHPLGLAIALALAIAAAGCAPAVGPVGAPSLTASPTATASPASPSARDTSSRTLDNGWTRLSSSAGFEIDIPPKWRQLELDAQSLDASLQSVGQQNPAFAQIFSSATFRQLMSSGLKAFAFDADLAHSDGTYVANVNVIQQPAPGLTLDTLTQAIKAQVESTFNTTATLDTVVMADGMPSGRLRYDNVLQSARGPLDLTLYQYVALRGPNLWIVTLAAQRTAMATYAPLFEAIGRSFSAK